MIIDTDKYIFASDAAKILGLTAPRMSQLCDKGRFPGQVKIGRFWLIPREAVENFTRRAAGRPPKASDAKDEISAPPSESANERACRRSKNEGVKKF